MSGLHAIGDRIRRLFRSPRAGARGAGGHPADPVVYGAGRAVVIAVCLSLAGGHVEVRAQAGSCVGFEPPVPPTSPGAPPDSAARSDAYFNWSHAYQRQTRGVGALSPDPRPDRPPSADWLPEISLPLWARPDDPEPMAWMHLGWWVAPGAPESPRILTYRGMMETSYEEASLVVTRARDDGWLEVWVDIGPVEQRGAATWGLVWTHRCALDLGPGALAVSMWEDVFTGSGAPALSFLGEERHALRSGPGVETRALAWLGPDDEVEILELDGEWARVRATRPGVYLTGCLGEPWDGEELEGWVKWKSPEAGTWLWYPTRGC